MIWTQVVLFLFTFLLIFESHAMSATGIVFHLLNYPILLFGLYGVSREIFLFCLLTSLTLIIDFIVAFFVVFGWQVIPLALLVMAFPAFTLMIRLRLNEFDVLI